MPFGKMTEVQTLTSASPFFPKGIPLNEGNGMSSLYKIQVSPCLVTCDHFPLVGFCISFSFFFLWREEWMFPVTQDPQDPL